MTGYTIALLGDTSFGENYQAEYEAAGRGNILIDQGYAYSLERFRSLLSACDLVIANLETPLTSLRHSALQGSKQYVHWSDVEATPLALGDLHVHAVSLANNHTMDQGAAGLQETLQSLARHGIASFGAGMHEDDATRPFVHHAQLGGGTRRLAVFGAFEVRRRYLLEYGFYAGPGLPGVASLRSAAVGERIRELKQQDPDTYVVVFPHWGQNYLWRTPKQTRLARELVEAGADLIVGHGAHMLGEIERVGDAWTVYSLGNFVFNSEGSYAEQDAPPYSLIAVLTFAAGSTGAPPSLRLYPILSDNSATRYQPRFLSHEEFEHATAVLLEHSPDTAGLRKNLRTGQDEFGPFLAFA